jgi:tetratricopeptide (TPR) repeat protein
MTRFPVEKPGVPSPSIADIWRVPQAVWRARRALRSGDLERARRLVAPLLDTYGSVTFIRKVAGEILYASGDPLSAASLFEHVAKRLPGDPTVTVGLVASYAALNRIGDARRAAASLPDHIDVRLALAWAELVALGGDREEGARMVEHLGSDTQLAMSRERVAMQHALAAIVAARAGDRAAAVARLREAERDAPRLRAPDRAFLAYLGGIALREAGAIDDARATFALAFAESPESIGAALGRRERANLDLGR